MKTIRAKQAKVSLQKFGFIKRVDKCWITTVIELEITTVKDLESIIGLFCTKWGLSILVVGQLRQMISARGCLQTEDRRPKTEDRRPKNEDQRPKSAKTLFSTPKT